jgi:translation initiation factor 2B subunit (eIF-2B alpha/beta/delta family)
LFFQTNGAYICKENLPSAFSCNSLARFLYNFVEIKDSSREKAQQKQRNHFISKILSEWTEYL